MASVPHSLVVLADPGTDNLPLQAGREQAAFPRAYSRSPEQGIPAGDHDTIAFQTNEIGDFLWFCGVPGHGQSGMWTRFVVTDKAKNSLHHHHRKCRAGARVTSEVTACLATSRGLFAKEPP